MKQAIEACPTCLNAGSQSPGQSPESLSLRVADPDPNLPLLGMAPQGQATDIAIQAEEIMKLKKQLYSIYAKHTKQSLQVIGERPLQGPRLLSYWNQHRRTGQASGPGEADTRLDRPVVGALQGPAGCVAHPQALPTSCQQHLQG